MTEQAAQVQLSKRVEDALKLTEGMTAMELANYAKAMRESLARIADTARAIIDDAIGQTERKAVA